MCGICGYVAEGVAPDAMTLEQMAQKLAARGPDDAGQYRDRYAALAHRRLSIIDVDGDRQPLANEDASIWAVANGEIYNFPELRARLQGQGHYFRTRTDSEVLVHLYEEHGERLVEHLNGMFAIALWDARRRKLLLARDRMGQKPLYYAPLADGLAFASELKALRAHPAVPGEVDPASLARYLLYQYVPAPYSIYRDVFKLDRAHALTYQTGRVRTFRYWQPPTADPAQRAAPLRRTADELWERLRESVRRRLLSDVPLGVFLSGGIDSSSIVACMSELTRAERIRTFTVGFHERSYDESEPARMVARYFGTEHHERFFDERDMLAVFPTVADYLDEPLADPSILPTYLLCRFAREHVKVALGGDGGDELLGGYPTFVATRSLPLYRKLPQWGRGGLAWLVDRLPVSHRNMSVDFLAREYLRGAATADPVANQIWMGAFGPAEQGNLLSAAVRDNLAEFDVSDELIARYEASAGHDPLARLFDFYSQTYLQEGILAKVDRASMANGLEVRAPFLDPEVVGYLGQLPTSYKVRGLATKRVLKRAARRRLPREIVARTKHGFGIPAAAWLSGALRDMVVDLLCPARLRQQGLFDAAYVGRLIDEHFSRQRNHRKPLWTLLVFQLWYERYAAAPRRSAAAQAPAPAVVPNEPVGRMVGG
ncbi:MAG: asparagine synthase (glutamine-hydrolyzing) [Pirellulales bacterium]